MKTLLAILVTALLLTTSIFASGGRCYSHTVFGGTDFQYNQFQIDLDDGDIIIFNEDEGSEVVITGDYELYVNGDLIDVDADQKELLKEFHTLVYDIKAQGFEIGKDGARIGISGAKLGLRAVANVFKLLSSDYDTDDLEYEMEKESEKIEQQADELEEKADELEKMAEDAEDLYEEMEDEIPALAELDWM